MSTSPSINVSTVKSSLCSYTYFVAFVENLKASGYDILFIKLCEGIAGLVTAAALKFEAVTRPAL